MTKIISLFIFLFHLLFTTQAIAQNIIYRGDKQFPATNAWSFQMNGNYWTSDPEVTVAKTSFGGYLMISIEVPFKQHYIGGTITVFLIDGTTIKCSDKGIRDHVDNKSIALYNFTIDEIERLKLARIAKIRFSIIGGMEGTQTFTADNKKFALSLFDEKQKEFYETDVEISELYKE